MSRYPQQSGFRKPFELEYASDNRQVSNFFNTVYAWMAVGLAVTGAVAWFGSQNMQMFAGVGRGGLAILGIAAFCIAMVVQMQAGRMSANVATVLFLVYAAILGLLLSYIFILYSAKTLISSFVLTGGVFGGMSIYGFVTKRDLTGIGSFLIMCVWGLLVASIVNIFVASDAMSWLITYAVLAVFIGLVAYETQMLKEMANQIGHDPVLAPRFAIVGSLMLYISFINIFISILRIMGDRK